MKMKKLAYIFTVAAFAFTLGACTDDEPEYNPAPAVEELPVYFSLENETDFEIFENTTSIDVPVYRKSAEGELVLPVNVSITPDEDGITYPASVTFADGEKEATFVFDLDMDQIKGRVDYKLTLTIADGVVTPYYADKVTYTLNYSPWDPVLGPNGETMALFRDDIVAPLFGLDIPEYEVEMQYNPVNPDIVRLVDPYANWPYIEDGDYDLSEKHYMYFNISNPNEVFLCDKDGVALGTNESDMFFHTGLIFYQDGEILITGFYNYSLYNGQNPSAKMVAELAQGNLTYGVDQILVGFADDDPTENLYYGNRSGEFRVLWPGAEPFADPTKQWNVLGQGQFTDGILFPLAIMEEDDEELPTYDVEVRQYAGDPNMYRIMNPWKAGVCPYGVDYSGDKYIELDCTNTNVVLMSLQSTGLTFGELGTLYIMNRGYYLTNNGSNAMQIIAQGANDTYRNGVISSKAGNLLYGFPGDDGKVSLSAGEFPWQLVMPNAPAGAPAKANALNRHFNGNGPLTFKNDNAKATGWAVAAPVFSYETKRK